MKDGTCFIQYSDRRNGNTFSYNRCILKVEMVEFARKEEEKEPKIDLKKLKTSGSVVNLNPTPLINTMLII